jgi:hypothetical protein
MNPPPSAKRVAPLEAAAINHRLILVSDVLTQRTAHNLIKLRIGS